MRFSEYSNLSEQKNLHLTHVEDGIFTTGKKGATESVEFLRSVAKMLHSNSPRRYGITVKFDGAPAIICGKEPGTGRFFVGTKSVFNANPKLNFTQADIKKNHGESPGLAEKLSHALTYLKELNIEGIIQGDLLFTPGDITIQKIDGIDHISFKPNTIMYAVPKSSKLGQEILSSKIGIVWHTKYSGSNLQSLKASFGVDISKLKKTKNVWSVDAYFKDETGSSTLTTDEYKYISDKLDKTSAMIDNFSRFIDVVVENYGADINIYLNALVRSGKFEPTTAGFLMFLEAKHQKTLESLKNEKAKQKRQVMHEARMNAIRSNAKKFNGLFTIHANLTSVKKILLNKLKKAKSIGSFLETPKGIKVTSPEGFVAVDHIGANAYKLVDRLEFSQANFNLAKNWVKG